MKAQSNFTYGWWPPEADGWWSPEAVEFEVVCALDEEDEVLPVEEEIIEGDDAGDDAGGDVDGNAEV